MGRNKKRPGGHGAKSKGHGGAPKEKNTANHSGTAVPAKGKGGMTSPVPGLSNLGNTCFFNAVMQCIGQSHYFKSRLDAHVQSPSFTCELRLPADGEREKCGRTVVVEDKVGELTAKLSSFLTQVRDGGGRTLNPKPVFSEICKKASRFSGYHQQDSQELLRYLLDSLRSEEIYRIKKALLLSYNVESGKAKVTENDRRDIKKYGIQAQLARTFVDDVFAGRLVSSVVCKECGNCSTIHEMFLDLSLPVAEDKVSQDHRQSKGQKKNKEGRKMAVTNYDSNGVANDFGEAKEMNHPFQRKEKEPSKHQQKKAKKQQEKAARKEAKQKAKQQQLQALMSGPSEVDPPKDETASSEIDVTTEGAAEEEKEMISQSSKPEEKSAEVSTSADGCQVPSIAHADISNSPNENQTTDPNTEESTAVAVDTEEQPSNEISSQDTSFVDYASAGPKPDSSMREVTELMGGATLDEAVAPPPGDEGQQPMGESATPPTTSDSTQSNGPEQVLTDLEISLKKFFAPELLTGSNKFACDVCSRKGAGSVSVTVTVEVEEEEVVEERTSDGVQQQEQRDGEEAGERMEREESETKDNGDGQEMQAAQRENGCQDDSQRTDRTDGDGGDEPSPSQPTSVEDHQPASSGEEEESEREEERDTVAGTSSHVPQATPIINSKEASPQGEESGGEGASDEEQAKPTSKSKLVFCEATKQFVMETLPLVLTLNLKRFTQHGRRLQKNNRHVSFPTLLNMAPYCTTTCQLGHCDSKGQLLYSLYGVVEHSGGMQGGHYTAYVRTRTPIKYDPSGVAPANQEEARPVQLAAGEASEAAGCSGVGSGEFDLTSTQGQWYFISDSRVRTATESEVVKSQAYLLFYEQLPLSPST